MKGYGGWLKIKNLPLEYWCKKTFKALGEYFGGLEEILTETPNLLNYSEAKIPIKRNLCRFMPSTIEIIDVNRRNIFLNFGDIEVMDPPNITKGPLCISDFTNPQDLVRLNQVMKDEGVHSS